MRACSGVVHVFERIFDRVKGDISLLGSSVAFPLFSEVVLASVCSESMVASAKLPGVVESSEGWVIVGDVYGNIHNVFRLFAEFGFPPAARYVFLGNFVEFGEFSLEVATLLLALSVVYADHIVALRGIAETVAVDAWRGLRDDVTAQYGRAALADSFGAAFGRLPFAFVIGKTVLCCQPGLVAQSRFLGKFRTLARFVEPLKGGDGFRVLISDQNRMTDRAVTRFVEENNLDCVISGGPAPENCFDVHADGLGIAISCCNTEASACAIPLVVGDTVDPFFFEAVAPVSRQDARFRAADPGRHARVGRKPATAPVFRKDV